MTFTRKRAITPDRHHFVIHQVEDPQGNPIGVGGNCHVFQCSGAVKVGDVVVITTSGKVILSTTSGDWVRRAGVVVGKMEPWGATVYHSSAEVGKSFADGSLVIVAVTGAIVYCVSGGTCTIGETCIPDSGTAGRVVDGTTARSIVGRFLDASVTAGDIVRVLLGA